LSNPYQPPAAPLGEEPAVVTVRRLIRIYQSMVVTSLLVGWVSFFGFLGFLATPEMAAVRQLGGTDAWLPPEVAYYAYLGLQPVWLLVTIGLCFFNRWARALFVGAYVFNGVLVLVSGVQVYLPWDYFLLTCTTLLDGAIMVLSFLPPLAGYFSREEVPSSS
jgi:hypothetical protein